MIVTERGRTFFALAAIIVFLQVATALATCNYQSKNDSGKIDNPAATANPSETPNSSILCGITQAVAKPKNRAIVNGIEVESDDPITIDITRTGPNQLNQVSGLATSAGLNAPSGDAVGAFNASAGSPSLPSIWGDSLSFTMPGGSVLSFKITSDAGLWGFAGLGALFLVGAVALWYFTRNIVLAACVGGIGVCLISIGLAPEIWAWSGLFIGVFGLGWLGIHIWRARGSKRASEELHEYDDLASDMIEVLTPDQLTMLKASLSATRRDLFDKLIADR